MTKPGRRHVLPVRVYFEDTDAGGIAYHASFIRWCERGRTDYLRLLGTDSRRMIDGSASHEPAAFVVRRMLCDFIRPARMDDVLEVETRVKEMGGASLTLLQVVTCCGPARVRSGGHGGARRRFGQAAPALYDDESRIRCSEAELGLRRSVMIRLRSPHRQTGIHNRR